MRGAEIIFSAYYIGMYLNSKEQVNKPFVLGEEADMEKFRLKEGDIVISKIARPLKFVLPKKDCSIYPAGNFYIIRIKPGSELNPVYLKSYLESKQGSFALLQCSSGGTMLQISKSDLLKLQIPFKSEKDQFNISTEYMYFENKIVDLELELIQARLYQKTLLDDHKLPLC